MNEKTLAQWIEHPEEMTDDRVKAHLSDSGIEGDDALVLLSSFKSEKKYGYAADEVSIRHVIALANKNQASNPLYKLIQNPFLPAKATWAYDHAPSFLLNTHERLEGRIDSILLEFAGNYDERFLRNESIGPLENRHKMKGPYKVLSTTFWERRIWDPTEIIFTTAPDLIV